MQVFFQWSMVQAMWFVGYKSYPLTISWRCFILTLTSKDCFKVKYEGKNTLCDWRDFPCRELYCIIFVGVCKRELDTQRPL